MLYIDLPTRSEIETLAAVRAHPAVSIYLRATPVSREAQADRVALKNLGRQAAQQLEATQTAKRSIWPIEAAIEALVEDSDFWSHQAHSLAVFLTPATVRTFRLANRIDNQVHVSDRFHIKPLLRAGSFPHDAWVLVLAEGGVKLVEISPDLPPREVSVPNLPKDAKEALGKASINRDLSHAGRSGEPTSESQLHTRYCRVVDRALRPVLLGHERPLILAAAEPLASHFPPVNTFPHLAEEVIAGNAERMSPAELAAAARSILDRIYARRLAELADLFAQREPQGRATADIAQAARAATFGAIDTLIVDMDSAIPGRIDEETGAVAFADAPGPETYGLVDEIARRALLTGARVLAARRDDIPAGGDLAAILRYPV